MEQQKTLHSEWGTPRAGTRTSRRGAPWGSLTRLRHITRGRIKDMLLQGPQVAQEAVL